MPGPADVQITIAQQVSTGYQQHIYQQQPIVITEQRLAIDKTKTQEQETTIQSLEGGGNGIKIGEKKAQGRMVKKRKRKEKQKEKKEEERISNGIRGKIIDVTG